jgi:hypothetical protein
MRFAEAACFVGERWIVPHLWHLWAYVVLWRFRLYRAPMAECASLFHHVSAEPAGLEESIPSNLTRNR